MWKSADGSIPIRARSPCSLSNLSQASRICAPYFSLWVRRPNWLEMQFLGDGSRACRASGIAAVGSTTSCSEEMLEEGKNSATALSTCRGEGPCISIYQARSLCSYQKHQDHGALVDVVGVNSCSFPKPAPAKQGQEVLGTSLQCE